MVGRAVYPLLLLVIAIPFAVSAGPDEPVAEQSYLHLPDAPVAPVCAGSLLHLSGACFDGSLFAGTYRFDVLDASGLDVRFHVVPSGEPIRASGGGEGCGTFTIDLPHGTEGVTISFLDADETCPGEATHGLVQVRPA